MLRFIRLLILLVGWAALGGAGWKIWQVRQSLAGHRLVRGVVYDTSAPQPSVSYLVGKKTFRFTVNESLPTYALEQGSIEVIYDPKAPERARPNTFRAKWGAAFPWAITGLVAAFVLVIIPAPRRDPTFPPTMT